MKDSLTIGLTTTNRLTVDEARTIDFLGSDGRVYATPELVRDIEITCRNLLLAHVDPGQDSVGARIEIDHMAPTLLGMWVEITATVANVDGRRVILNITARDNLEEIARGQHIRFIIDVAKSAIRFMDKAEKVAAL